MVSFIAMPKINKNTSTMHNQKKSKYEYNNKIPNN